MSKLVNCNIRFHTNDDDKDWNTNVTILVYDVNRRLAARISNMFGKFPDHTDSGPYALTIYNQSTIEELQRGSVVLKIDPVGHDTWKFNYYLDLIFDNGMHLSGSQDNIILDQDHREQTFGLDGYKPSPSPQEPAASFFRARL